MVTGTPSKLQVVTESSLGTEIIEYPAAVSLETINYQKNIGKCYN